MLNIVIAGHHYPVTAFLEYITRAFRRREDCRVLTVGPFTGNWIPWSQNNIPGMLLPAEYEFRPDIILPESAMLAGKAPIQFVESQLPADFIPDLWLDVNAGFYLQGKPKNGKRAMIETDPHVLRQLYDGIMGQYDFVFCTQTPYAREGEIYLPFAADSEWHSPMVVDEIKYDVALIGNTYQSRVDFMGRLAGKGLRTFFKLGPAKWDARRIYCQSLIGVNISSMQDLTARVFELMGLGVCPVVNRVPDLQLFEEGNHFVGFDTLEQAEQVIANLLAHKSQIHEIGLRAMDNIKKFHTYDHRAKTILESCKFDII